jgi:gluconolactonase
MTLGIRHLTPDATGLIAADAQIEQVATGFMFTEGPLWDRRDDSLLFSDIPANRIYRWKEGSGAEVFKEPSGKSNGLTWDREWRLLACEHLNRRVTSLAPDGTTTVLVDRYESKRLNSPNDLVIHSSGAVYFSDPPYGIQSESVGALAEQEQPVNGLYMVRLGETEPVLLAKDFDRPNGLAFSPDESRLYVNDTPRYHIRAFHVGSDGMLSGGEVLAYLSADAGEGRPDGLKVDVEGNLYTTGPGGLWVVRPSGELAVHVQFPEKTANCAWGDDGHSLYVTASTSVYRIRTLLPGRFAH